MTLWVMIMLMVGPQVTSMIYSHAERWGGEPQGRDGARLQPVEVQRGGLLPEETLGVDAAGGLFANQESSVEWPLNSLQPIPHFLWSHPPGDGGSFRSLRLRQSFRSRFVDIEIEN